VTKKTLLLSAAGLGLPLVAFAFYWFGPHLLFIDDEVSEVMPEAASILAGGDFRSLEHETSGNAQILKQADGKLMLRLHDLATSNGPELHVYLSDAKPQDDWGIYDDGQYVDLGPLKGNLGSSNYDLPAGTNLASYQSAVVWCRRFGVGFGVAPLDAAD
jgi:hypothetical protein